MNDGWLRACKADDLGADDVIRFDHNGRTFAIYRTADGEYFATDGLCTHAKAHLADGFVMDGVIECPKHNGRFDFRTGKAKGRPPAWTSRRIPSRSRAAKSFSNWSPFPENPHETALGSPSLGRRRSLGASLPAISAGRLWGDRVRLACAADRKRFLALLLRTAWSAFRRYSPAARRRPNTSNRFAQVAAAAELGPRLINSHSGRDGFTEVQSERFFAEALRIEAESGAAVRTRPIAAASSFTLGSPAGSCRGSAS